MRSSWKHVIVMDNRQVSSLCVLTLESLRSEEVILKKCMRLFVVIYKHVLL